MQKQQDQRQHISCPDIGRAINKVAKQRGDSNYSNREWEVGGNGYKVDDEQSLKR